MQRSALSVVLYPCLFDAAAVPVVQLLPHGEFAARDGRPGPGRKWKASDADGRRVAARLNQRKTHMVFDYEHQTINAAKNGQPAPAMAWATKFEWRDGVGLFALDVDWTERGANFIKTREYKYISPVIVARRSDDVVVDVLHVAITNDPAIDGMDAVTARIAAAYDAAQSTPETETMSLLERIIAALKLAKDATEDAVVNAVVALSAQAAEAQTLTTQLNAQIAALKANTGTSDDTIKDLQKQIATLTAAQAKRELDEVIEAALATGKLLPAQEKWARSLSMEALRGYVDSAPAIAALAGTQSGGRGHDGQTDVAALKQKAAKYIADQAALGIHVQADEAVRHAQQAA